MPTGHHEGGSPEQLRKILNDLLAGLSSSSISEVERPYVAFQGWNPNLPANLQRAPVNPTEERYLASARDVGQHVPFLNRAQTLSAEGSMRFPEMSGQYMNPYQEQVANRMSQLGNRNFTENILPALEAKFVRLGQHGGSRHAQLAQRAARDTQNEISAMQGQLMHHGYGQAAARHAEDQARKLKTAELDAMLGKTTQAQHLIDTTSLGGAGAHERENAQALIDLSREEQERMHGHKARQLSHAAGIAHGTRLESPYWVPHERQSMGGKDYLKAAMQGAAMVMGQPSDSSGTTPAPVERRSKAGGSIRQFSPRRR